MTTTDEDGWSSPAHLLAAGRSSSRRCSPRPTRWPALPDRLGRARHRGGRAVERTRPTAGPRRLRPGTVSAAQTIDSARADAATEPPPGPAPSRRRRRRRSRRANVRATNAARGRCWPTAARWRSPAWPAGSPASCAASCSWPRSAPRAVGDAYNVGNNFPNMVYELLLGGVLSSVLIPLLVHAQERRRRRRRRLHPAAAVDRHGGAGRDDPASPWPRAPLDRRRLRRHPGRSAS